MIADAGVSGVPVLDAEDRVVGVVSVSDLVRRRADHDDETIMPLDSVDDDGNDIAIEGGRPAGSALCACDVMTPGAETVAPDANLREVARRMVDSGIHRVLVVKDDRLEGIISTFDILRALAE